VYAKVGNDWFIKLLTTRNLPSRCRCREVKEIHVGLHTHIYICMYVCMYVCMSTYPKIKLHMFIIWTIKKVKLSLCLNKHHAMKTYWGVEI
jgi:hypothetical protein